MPDQLIPEDREASLRAPARRRHRRLAAWLGGGLGAILLTLVLVIFVLPTPVARHVIERQLDRLGIAHDGIDSVVIDLWNSRISVGPVSFRSGDVQAAQIGETGFEYSFGELIEGRAFLQTFYLRGVDLFVARKEDGSIEINGVKLQRFGNSRNGEDPELQALEDGGEAAFGFGGERFEFADSRLVFQDVSGGTLTMDLERLTLDRVLSWTPDEPTTFELEGRLNDIQMSLDGTVIPLGDPLVATLNTRVSGVTLDKVARFVGPTGLDRQDGTLDTEVHYDYAFHRDGRIEGTVDGIYTLDDVELVSADGATASVGQAVLKVELRQTLQRDSSTSAAGRLTVSASPLSLSSPAGDAVEVGALELAFDDLDFTKGAQERRRLLETALPATEADPATGGVPTVVDLLAGWVEQLGQEILDHQLSISGHPSLAVQDGLFRIGARGDAPAQEIRFGDFTADLGTVTSHAFDAGVDMESGFAAAIAGLRYAMDGGHAQAELSTAEVNARSVRLRATREETSLNFDLDVLLRQLAASADRGQSLDLDRLSLTTDSFVIKETSQGGTATGPVSLSLSDLAAGLPGPDGLLSLRGEGLDMALSPLTVTDAQGELVGFPGSFALRGLALERGGDRPLSGSLASMRTELREMQVAPLDAQAEITGGLTTTLAELRLEAGQGADAVALSLESADNLADALRITSLTGGLPSVSLSNRLRVSGLSASLPSAEGAVSLRGDGLDIDLSPVTLSGAQGADFTGSVALRGLALERGGDSPLTGSLGSTGIDLQEVRVAPLDAQAEITGGLTTTFTDLRLEAGQGDDAMTLSLESVANQAEALRISDLTGGLPSITLSSQLRLNKLSASLPSAEGAVSLRGDGLDIDLSPLTLSGAQGADFTGSVALRGLALERGGDSPLSGSLASTGIDLQGIRVAPLDAQAEITGALATTVTELRLEAGQGDDAMTLSLESVANQAEGLQMTGLAGETPTVSLANRTRLTGLAARLPIAGDLAVEAAVASLDAPLSELSLSDGAVRAQGAVEATGLSARTDGEDPQSLDLSSLSITGLDGDSESGAQIERIALGVLDAKVMLPLPSRQDGDAADQDTQEAGAPGETAGAQSDERQASEQAERRFKLGELLLAPGSRIAIVDEGIEPPVKADLLLEELRVGAIDTAAPETRTDLALALVANETSTVKLRGWAAPLKPKPDFELSSEVEGLPLSYLSPYAAPATGVNIESGDLFAGIVATASDAALDGNIELRIDDLFVSPLSREEAERLKANIGLPVGFAVTILKDTKGVIAFDLPLSGTIDAPKVDYRDAVNEAITGAMASVFPTTWFGPDGTNFAIKPAPFMAASAELTPQGVEVIDYIGGLLTEKPGISIRTCGKAGRADLVALRGGPPAPPATAPVAVPESETDVVNQAVIDAAGPPGEREVDAAAAAGKAPAGRRSPKIDIAAPNEAEAQALLVLATERRAAVGKYLEAKYGIDRGQLRKCRTTYSIEDDRPPRAEFQF